ncbi:reverse transcriptase domain-containing protein [Tanacetum coccineum]
MSADPILQPENPHQNEFENKEITETFPLETLGLVALRDDSTPWFADFANYHAGNFIVKGMPSQQKNKFFKDVKPLLLGRPLSIQDLCRPIDYLSKWVEAKALPTNDARVVCKFLKTLFSRFGAPRAIISDRGTHFCNDQFTKVMLKYGVTHRLSTAYHPQTSGQVEVSNRGLKRILERTIGENRASWSDKLDDALWAFRTAYKTPIGCTPYKLVYGKACHLPIELEHKAYWALKHTNFNIKTAGDHRKVQLNELNELRDHAYENSLIYKEKTKRIHDSKIKNRVFNVGDRVLLFNSRLKIFSGKLKTRWSGPFTVTQVFPYGTIELSQNSGPNFKVNGHRLKHYFGGDVPTEDFPDCDDSHARSFAFRVSHPQLHFGNPVSKSYRLRFLSFAHFINALDLNVEVDVENTCSVVVGKENVGTDGDGKGRNYIPTSRNFYSTSRNYIPTSSNLSIKKFLTNLNQPSTSTLVVDEIHNEEQQTASGSPSLWVTSKEGAHPQHSSADSIAEVDPRISAPHDSIPQQWGIDERTQNYLPDHIFVGTNPNVLVDKTKSVGDGLKTAHTNSGTNEESQSAKISRKIKLEDLSNIMQDKRSAFISLDSVEDEPIIITDESEVEEAKRYEDTNTTSHDPHVFDNSISPELKELPSKITELFGEVKELKKHVQEILTTHVAELKTLQWEFPREFLCLPRQVSSVQENLKTLDALPSLLKKVTNTLNRFATIVENASPKVWICQRSQENSQKRTRERMSDQEAKEIKAEAREIMPQPSTVNCS